MRLRSLGDIVLETPAIAALHAWRPDLRLNVLVESAFAAVLEGNPAVAEVIEFRGMAATARLLRRRKFAAVFNQHAGPRSALLTWATGAPVRVGWRTKQFARLYNYRALEPQEIYGHGAIHAVEHRMAQFYWAGLPRQPIPCAEVFPQPDALEAVASRLAGRGIPRGANYAVIFPGASTFTKRWATEEFSAAAKHVLARHNLAPVFCLGPGEEEIRDAVQERVAKEFAVLESLELRELIALVAGARLFLGNDAGPAHVAAAAGVPAVVIFGSSNSVQWRPWGVRHRVVQNEFACNPCPGDRCYAFDAPQCILSIAVEQVCRACDEVMAEVAREQRK